MGKALKRSQSELHKPRLDSMISTVEREVKEFTAVRNKVGMGNNAPDYLYYRALEAAEKAELAHLKLTYEAMVAQVIKDVKAGEADA
ncbi:MAG: hypothetical protein H7317_14390 [Pseudorhodobacter sp.]|nr:hypothetical protein [Pseudorhodobacter sp.]